MEKCYEYFACTKTDCIMFKKDSKECNCWDYEETLCNHPYIDSLNIDKCKICLYYRSVNPQKNN